MIVIRPLLSPLIEHVTDEEDCFRASSAEYAELLLRLQGVEALVNHAEAALRQITQLAAARNHPKSALAEVLPIAMENVGLTQLAVSTLDDIILCMEYLEPNRRRASLLVERWKKIRDSATDDELAELRRVTPAQPAATGLSTGGTEPSQGK